MKYQVSISRTARYVEPNNGKQVKQKMAASIMVLIFMLIVLLLIGTLILLAGIFSLGSGKVCLTEECVNTASRIIRAMDQSINPCEDFYEYACGGWVRSNPIPDSTFTWDRLAVLRESLMLEMKQLLEEESNETSSSVVKARKMYKNCMDTDKLENNGLIPLEKILRELGLPSLPNSPSDNFDWLFTVARARRLLGVSILYGFNVAEDVRNSSINKIVIEQIPPGFSERYLLQPQKFSWEIQNYKNYILKMIQAYTNRTEVSFADDVIDFSTQLAKVMTPAEIRRGPGHLFHEVTLLELITGPGFNNDTWKTVNWTRYTNIIFNDTNVVLQPRNDTAILLDLHYMQRIANLLTVANKTALRKFIWWNVFSTVAPLTLAKFRVLGFEFSQTLLGLKTRTPRWKICTNTVNANFGLALSYLYVKSHFDDLYRKKALEMLGDIKDAFQETVYKLDWMDSITREKTLTKLRAIRAFVGYPGWIMNETHLDNHYAEAHVIDGNLFESYLNLTNAAIKRNLQSIRKKADRNRWVATATTVNAFYSATLNSVTFPAGILKPPFYGNGISAIDYGSIGAIMGHEVTHGFDDQGRRYDEHGNLKQWWSLATLDHYHTKVKCIIEQYNNYSLPELGSNYTVHGYNTQGENIADNGGLRAAFEGYQQQRLRTAFPIDVLPGLLHLTADQLFFLGFAQIWCGNSTIEALKNKIIDGVHSPNKLRVLGSLRNSQEFSQAWHCPSGSSMNPKSKCVLW